MRSLAYHNKKPTDLPDSAPADAAKAEFARRLQTQMVRKGWNQSELARRAEAFCSGKRFGRDNISIYIRGKAIPGALHLEALCKALNLQPEDLVPTRGVPSAGGDNPPLDVRDMGDGRVWMRVNQAIDWATALKVMALLKDVK